MNGPYIVIGLIIVAISNIAQAQYPGNYNISPYSQYMWVEPHHSATVGESYLRGSGAFLRGWGDYSYLRGMGAQSYEQARQQYIYNRMAALDARRRLRENYVASRQKLSAPRDCSDLVRQCLPRRPHLGQLGLSGQIYWPELLLAEEYRQPRQVLDELFRQRANGVPMGQRTAARKAIVNETNRMQSDLASRINDYTVAEYLAARKFIESLRYEAQFDAAVVLTSL